MNQSHKHLFTHKISLIGAILVTALLLVVGGIFWIFSPSGWAARGTTNPQKEIYFSAGRDLVKMEAQTHKVLWQQPIPAVGKLIPAGDVLYVMQQPYLPQPSPGPPYVLAIDAKSGHTLWTHPFITPAGMIDMELVDMESDKDRLYVAIKSLDMRTFTGPSQIYVLDTSNGKQRSVYPGVADIASITLGDGLLAMSTDNSHLTDIHSLQVYDLASGMPRWHVSIGTLYIQSMRIVDGLLYVSIPIMTTQIKSQAYLTIYKADTGEVVWQSATFTQFNNGLESFTEFNNGPASIYFTIVHNILYFSTNYSTNYSTTQPPTRDTILAGEVSAYDVLHKKMLWTQKMSGNMNLAPVVQNGLVYVSTSTGTNSKVHIVALTVQKGEIKWQKTLNNWHKAFDNSGIVRLYANNSIAYAFYSSGSSSNATFRLDALKADNGDVLWDFTLPYEYITVSP